MQEPSIIFHCQTYSLLDCSVLLLNFTLCFCFLGVPPFSSIMMISSSSAILFKFKSVSCNTLYEPTGEILDMLQGMSKLTCFLEYELSMGLEAKIPFLLTSSWSSLLWSCGFPEISNMSLSWIIQEHNKAETSLTKWGKWQVFLNIRWWFFEVWFFW